MRIEAIGAGAGREPAVIPGENRRTRRFWVPLVWAAVPTVLVTSFTCFFWRYYEPPEFLVGVLFFAVVIPAAVICEKLGFGQFSILGVSTVPDWLFFSVMMVLVYLYCLVLVGLVHLALQARRTVRGERWKSRSGEKWGLKVDVVDGVGGVVQSDGSRSQAGGSRRNDDVSLSSPGRLVRRMGEQAKNRKVNR